MSSDRIWSAEELLELSPAERDEIIRARITSDLSAAPPHLLEQARADISAHLNSTD